MIKKRWDEVITKGNAYKEKINDAAEIKEVDLAIAWSQLQQQLNPNQLTSKEKLRAAIGELQTFYRANRADTNFSKYRKDLVESAYQLVKIGADFLTANPDSNLHDAFQPLLEMAKDAGNELSDKDQVKQWEDETKAKYAGARTAIDAQMAKSNWLGRMQDVLAKENLGQIDALQAEYQDLIKQSSLAGAGQRPDSQAR